jgi:hypothetical protein
VADAINEESLQSNEILSEKDEEILGTIEFKPIQDNIEQIK